VLRNYQDVVKESGGEILYTCKKEECGGDPERSSEGGGGEMSLMMYFVYANQLKDADFSNGKCALTPYVDDQRFFAAKIPQGGGDAYVTVQTFQVKDNLYCKAFNERTVALVHIVEPKPREQKMVVVKAEEMARSIVRPAESRSTASSSTPTKPSSNPSPAPRWPRSQVYSRTTRSSQC
jgi:hypothetical protein